MRAALALLLLLPLPFVTFGCTPQVRVSKSPGVHDKGIRYYRPKPYLLVTPASEDVKTVSEKDPTGKTSTSVTTKLTDRFVTLKLEYLPDFSEEYSIRVRPGIGVATVNVTLDQGWNLTAINQTLDSKVPDTIKAVGELAKSVGSFALTGGADAPPAAPVTVVCASEVPLGYYESVISRGPDGCKRLYGWRYVGFLPFNACPTTACGTEQFHCNADQLFGLVFWDGVMTFRPLNTVAEAAMDEVPPKCAAPPMPAAVPAADKPPVPPKDASELRTLLHTETVEFLKLGDQVKVTSNMQAVTVTLMAGVDQKTVDCLKRFLEHRISQPPYSETFKSVVVAIGGGE